MSGYWIVMAIAALAMVAVVIAILSDEELSQADRHSTLRSIATFGIARLPDGKPWVPVMCTHAGPVPVFDHTHEAIDRADLSALFDSMRTIDDVSAVVLALPALEPGGENEVAAWERALSTTLAELRRRGTGVVVLLPESTPAPIAAVDEGMSDAVWHATVARLVTGAGALLLTIGADGPTGSDAEAVAAGAIAWLGGVAHNDAPTVER